MPSLIFALTCLVGGWVFAFALAGLLLGLAGAASDGNPWNRNATRNKDVVMIFNGFSFVQGFFTILFSSPKASQHHYHSEVP